MREIPAGATLRKHSDAANTRMGQALRTVTGMPVMWAWLEMGS